MLVYCFCIIISSVQNSEEITIFNLVIRKDLNESSFPCILQFRLSFNSMMLIDGVSTTHHLRLFFIRCFLWAGIGRACVRVDRKGKDYYFIQGREALSALQKRSVISKITFNRILNMFIRILCIFL